MLYTSFAVAKIVAPAFIYDSSENPDPRPALVSTLTV